MAFSSTSSCRLALSATVNAKGSQANESRDFRATWGLAPNAGRGVFCHRTRTDSFGKEASAKQNLARSLQRKEHSAQDRYLWRPRGSLLDAAITELDTPEADDIEALVSTLKWNSPSGLVVAIAQNVDTGDVMMQGFADRKAVTTTLATGRATFFSRSRKCLWTKGEVSGNFIRVLDVFVDCDRDTLIYLGVPDGPTCHTGETTCFFDRLRIGGAQETEDESKFPLTSLYAMEHTIAGRHVALLEAEDEAARGEGRRKPSWTQRLLSDPSLLCSKIREEADELCRTLEETEGKERAASEMADLLYHSLVLLRLQGVELEEVAAVLRSRFGKSGIEEKASRKLKVAS